MKFLVVDASVNGHYRGRLPGSVGGGDVPVSQRSATFKFPRGRIAYSRCTEPGSQPPPIWLNAAVCTTGAVGHSYNSRGSSAVFLGVQRSFMGDALDAHCGHHTDTACSE